MVGQCPKCHGLGNTEGRCRSLVPLADSLRGKASNIRLATCWTVHVGDARRLELSDLVVRDGGVYSSLPTRVTGIDDRHAIRSRVLVLDPTTTTSTTTTERIKRWTGVIVLRGCGRCVVALWYVRYRLIERDKALERGVSLAGYKWAVNKFQTLVSGVRSSDETSNSKLPLAGRLVKLLYVYDSEGVANFLVLLFQG